MPGFIEAHGHPLMEAVALSDRIVDIRPVTRARRRRRRRARSTARWRNGEPTAPTSTAGTRCCSPDCRTRRWRWLDDVAPDGPLVIIHNSGHKAFFNSHAARLNGLTRDTPDPKGAKYRPRRQR